MAEEREERVEEGGWWVIPVALRTMSALAAYGLTDPDGYRRLMASIRETLEDESAMYQLEVLAPDLFAKTLGYTNWADLVRESEDFGADRQGRHWYITRIEGHFGQIIGYAAWHDQELQVAAVHFAATYAEALKAIFRARIGMPVY